MPDDLKYKQEWHCGNKKLGTAESGQGDVYLVRRTSGHPKGGALKIYKEVRNESRRLRSYRETVALRSTEDGKNMVLNIALVVRVYDTSKEELVPLK